MCAPVQASRIHFATDSFSRLTSYRKPAFGSLPLPPLPSNRLLISSISVLVVMTENQVNVPVDSCYQVKCGKCGKTTWKVCFLGRDFDHYD